MLDPYREEMLDKNFSTFSFGGHLNFEAYVQYQEYCGFTKAMDTLRAMKLMLKGDDGKAVACNIKVFKVLIVLKNYAVCGLSMLVQGTPLRMVIFYYYLYYAYMIDPFKWFKFM